MPWVNGFPEVAQNARLSTGSAEKWRSGSGPAEDVATTAACSPVLRLHTDSTN